MIAKGIAFFIMMAHAFAAYTSTDVENLGLFSGRISRLNSPAKLMRVKIDFENAKFLTDGLRVEFWNETYPNRRCQSFIEGRSNEYILLKVPKYPECITHIHMSTGTYLHLYAPRLKENLAVARELIDILLKKRLAMQSRMGRYKKELDIHIEKVSAINKRYETLKEKMDIEWQNEIAALEEDQQNNKMQYQQAQIELEEIMHKLHRYRIYDQNLKDDRWALDSKLYIKK